MLEPKTQCSIRRCYQIYFLNQYKFLPCFIVTYIAGKRHLSGMIQFNPFMPTGQIVLVTSFIFTVITRKCTSPRMVLHVVNYRIERNKKCIPGYLFTFVKKIIAYARCFQNHLNQYNSFQNYYLVILKTVILLL